GEGIQGEIVCHSERSHNSLKANYDAAKNPVIYAAKVLVRHLSRDSSLRRFLLSQESTPFRMTLQFFFLFLNINNSGSFLHLFDNLRNEEISIGSLRSIFQSFFN